MSELSISTVSDVSSVSFRKAKDVPRSSLRGSRIIEELSITKLQFDKLGFYGREREVNEIQDVLTRVFGDESKKNRELILISGQSGTGKTSLAKELERPVIRANGFYISGKFDL